MSTPRRDSHGESRMVISSMLRVGLLTCQDVCSYCLCGILGRCERRGTGEMTQDSGFDVPALRPQDWRRPATPETRSTPRLSRGAYAAAQLISIAESAQPGDRIGSKEELRARCSVS